MSVYHFWASGFGLVREVLHRGIHISYVIGLVFILFGWKKTDDKIKNKFNFLNFQDVNLLDYFCIISYLFGFIFTFTPT